MHKVKNIITQTIARSQDQLNELKKEADFCKEQMKDAEDKLKKHKKSAKEARDAYEDAKAENQKLFFAEFAIYDWWRLWSLIMWNKNLRGKQVASTRIAGSSSRHPQKKNMPWN